MRSLGLRLAFVASVIATLVASGCWANPNAPADPLGILPSVKQNTVTIVGYRHRYESHVPDKVAALAKTLAEKDVAYFLVETPKDWEKDVRAIISSKADKQTLEFYRIGYGRGFPTMLKELAKAGIQVVVEDLPYINGNPQDSSLREENYLRVITNLLQQKPKAKVVLLIGAFHAKPIKEGLLKQKVTTNVITVEEPDKP